MLIEGKEQGAELEVFHHNRFRWFDEKEVHTQIEKIIEKPSDIDQADTSLCGMAAIFYLFAKEKPAAYKKYVLDLLRTGEASCNNYIAKPSIDITDRKIKLIYKGEGEDKRKVMVAVDSGSLSMVDFITLAGTRNNESSFYKGGNQKLAAINWPHIMTNLLEQLMGYQEVSSTGCYTPVKPLITTTFATKSKIDDINKQLEKGYRLVLMIDSDLIEDEFDFDEVDHHWVTLETPIQLDESLNTVDFKVYSWRSTKHLEKPISLSHFMNNYYGYIKIK